MFYYNYKITIDSCRYLSRRLYISVRFTNVSHIAMFLLPH